jgi:hypothetical protein
VRLDRDLVRAVLVRRHTALTRRLTMQTSDSTVYLLHFDRAYQHARHTPGTATDLDAAHERGRGARLLEVVHDAGIGWQLARTWPGGRARERQIKRQGDASRRCPLCGVTPRTTPQQRPGHQTQPANEASQYALAYLQRNGPTQAALQRAAVAGCEAEAGS